MGKTCCYGNSSNQLGNTLRSETESSYIEVESIPEEASMTFNTEDVIRTYVYPLFFASNLEQLITRMSCGTVIYAILTLFGKEAPYGRHANSRHGFGVPAKISWAIHSCPSFFVPVLLTYFGNKTRSITNQLCLGMFVMHYFQRSFIYSLLTKSQKPTPFLPFFLSILTTLYNGILHGLYFTNYYQYNDEEWLISPNFWIGVILFLYGMKINIGGDSALRKLRKAGETGYKIPTGGWFEEITCPNYFGEIIEMWGYALASLSPPAAAHAFFTTIFLTRRALHHQKWYLTKFEDYPKNRKAVFPYLL